jgi:hypothetical protein
VEKSPLKTTTTASKQPAQRQREKTHKTSSLSTNSSTTNPEKINK